MNDVAACDVPRLLWQYGHLCVQMCGNMDDYLCAMTQSNVSSVFAIHRNGIEAFSTAAAATIAPAHAAQQRWMMGVIITRQCPPCIPSSRRRNCCTRSIDEASNLRALQHALYGSKLLQLRGFERDEYGALASCSLWQLVMLTQSSSLSDFRGVASVSNQISAVGTCCGRCESHAAARSGTFLRWMQSVRPKQVNADA